MLEAKPTSVSTAQINDIYVLAAKVGCIATALEGINQRIDGVCGNCDKWMIARQCRREANGTKVSMNMHACQGFRPKTYIVKELLQRAPELSEIFNKDWSHLDYDGNWRNI